MSFDERPVAPLIRKSLSFAEYQEQPEYLPVEGPIPIEEGRNEVIRWF